MSEPESSTPGPNPLEGFTRIREDTRRYVETVLESGPRLLYEQMRAGRDLMRAAEAGLLVPDESPSHLRFLVSVNSQPHIEEVLRGVRVPVGDSLAGCVYTTGQAVALANPEDYYDEVDHLTGLSTQVYLAVPVHDRGELLGVVTFVNRPADASGAAVIEPFDAEEIARASRFASLVALGLRYHRRVEVLGRLFKIDLAEVLPETGRRRGPRRAGVAPDPMTRILQTLEQLPTERHSLTADLIGVLAEHVTDPAESGHSDSQSE